jgi:hypothetical protein
MTETSNTRRKLGELSPTSDCPAGASRQSKSQLRRHGCQQVQKYENGANRRGEPLAANLRHSGGSGSVLLRRRLPRTRCKRSFRRRYSLHHGMLPEGLRRQPKARSPASLRQGASQTFFPQIYVFTFAKWGKVVAAAGIKPEWTDKLRIIYGAIEAIDQTVLSLVVLTTLNHATEILCNKTGIGCFKR